jgi:hypothetical protein
MPTRTIADIERELAQIVVAAESGDPEATKKFKLLGAELRTRELFASSHANRGEFEREKKERERAAAEREFKINEARSALAAADIVDAAVSQIDPAIAALGKTVAETLKAATVARASAQASLGCSPTTDELRHALMDSVQKNLANANLTLLRYGVDPSAPTVVLASKAFVDGLRSEMEAQLRALGEKP